MLAHQQSGMARPADKSAGYGYEASLRRLYLSEDLVIWMIPPASRSRRGWAWFALPVGRWADVVDTRDMLCITLATLVGSLGRLGAGYSLALKAGRRGPAR